MVKAVYGLAWVLATLSAWNAPTEVSFLPSMAQTVQDASLFDRTHDFTDLYIIHTRDKERNITIHCSAHSCYKNRPAILYV
ncbi:hypothetical protein GCM10011297_11360 [Bacterioplanes sanyensis]|uniref:hypothetical protein n=1 Tax=Bacterioplanes sanyensis TaxID=1249553 RepID=UPI0016722BDE|nr:hypothetical protein [Bacterioplanes sanyensis]GGY39793.1 hypothetical protein GCM10011297_11360 [Bacterioplanes sanyensis]